MGTPNDCRVDKKVLLRALGQRLRARRLALGLTQQELAAKIGIHYTFLGYIERGRKLPNLITLIRIAKTVHVPLTQLICPCLK